MLAPRNLFALLFALLALTVRAAAGPALEGATLKGTTTVPSGATLTLSGALGGTPTGGTLSLANVTLTLPSGLTLTSPTINTSLTLGSGVTIPWTAVASAPLTSATGAANDATGGAGGTISLVGGAGESGGGADGGIAGTITMNGGAGSPSLNGGSAGDINTSASGRYSGGALVMNSDGSISAGSINTQSGGSLTMGSAHLTGPDIAGTILTDSDIGVNVQTFLSATATGTGSVVRATAPTVTGLVLGDTVSYSTTPSDTKALSGELLRLWFGGQSFSEFVFGENGGDVTSGTGSVTGGTGAKVLTTGATSSSAAATYANPNLWSTNPGALGGFGSFNWSKPAVVAARFASSTDGFSANALFRVTVGKTNGNGALNAKGIGFGVIYDTATTGSVIGYAHDGSTLTTSAALATVDLSSSGYVHQVVGISDGTGNVYFFVDNTYAGTMTGGPTTVSSSTRYVVAEILNNADSASSGVITSSVRLWFKP